MKWIDSLKRNLAVFAILNTLLVCAALLITGCQTNSPSGNASSPERLQDLVHQQTSGGSATFTIREGDQLRIVFAGAPNLNTVQLVRRDGKIALPLLGELQAAGLSPKQLEDEILKQYGSQILTKEVTVTIDSASYDVFVTGAVVKPGKVSAIRPMTALEAIMESGGFDYSKASLKDVRVIRQENGRARNYTLNLKEVLEGKRSDAFLLKPQDIVYIREKFNWF